jgi:hypothetical protein
LEGPASRTRPYRNSAIIRVIRDLYFSGGSNAFATRHLSRFARFEEYDGSVRIEVPTAMVALVSTAVSSLSMGYSIALIFSVLCCIE